ncbi:TonB-dependent receptor [Pedobacter sp. BAL39]|uniref:TonB-dependent receptor n=1 Tax=Pedobacter sp. BAL39 TaxID=391596 RepID=UPI00058767D9|nr:TonB-dependent receptor [Pedobacter sp. BAL39]
MKKILLFAIIMTCLSTMTFAQSGLLTGQVTDQQKLSLPGAVLNLTPGNIHTVSDTYGKFQFLNVPQGTYKLTVTYIGYNIFTTEVTMTRERVVTVNVGMEEAAIVGKEVVIMGDRLRGQAKALNIQKNKMNVSNIVSADQVGRFPDANIGDAVKRIPGITMQNDQGEARNIIIRGLAPELNSVTINGDRIPSAEGDNRRVQMDLIPSDMIQTIEVSKTLTPDMDADAIGGSVNLITRATPNGERISATISGGYAPIREKPLYNGSFVYGNRFFDNKFGMVLSGSFNHNNYGSDNVEAVWKKDDFGNTFIEEQDIRKYDIKRIRRSAAAALDYKFNEKNNISFNAMYNWRDDKENRYRFQIKDLEPVYDVNDNITGYTGAINRQTKGGINNNRVDNARLEEQKVQNYSLNGEHVFGSKLDFHWSLNYARASEYRPNERYISYEASDVTFNSDFGPSRYPFVNPVMATALNDYELDEITENTDKTQEDEFGARLDFRVPLSAFANQKGRLRFGARLRLKNKDRNNTFTEYSPLNGDLDNLSQTNQQFWGSNNWQPDQKYQPGTFASKQYLGGLQLSNTSLFEAEDVAKEYLAANYNAKETITAGYLRWDQDFSTQLSMIAGMRLENTKIKYEGNLIQDESELEGTRRIENSYLNVLPGLTFKYVPLENMVIRAAATTALARPNYYTLTPFVNTVMDDSEISAGNPDLKASYAWNYDLMGEYYFKSVGIISGGLFYKKINNFIYQFRDENLTTAKFAEQFPDLGNPVPAGESWTLTQARNGEAVKVYGFEVAMQRQLDFLPGKFLQGFGVYANYTYTKSKASGIFNEDGEMRSGIALPGTAPHMFNASLSWENKKFSARLSLNYTADYIDELGGNDFEDRFYDKQVFLDANASYVIAKSWRIFGEANNLTNQPLRYYQGVASQTMQMEYYRSKFNLGLKFDLNK